MDDIDMLFKEYMIFDWMYDFCKETGCRICSESVTDNIPVLLYPDYTYEKIFPFTVIRIQEMYENWEKHTIKKNKKER